MEKVKQNLPYVLFILLGLKILILGSSSIFDTLSLFVLGLGLAFFELRVENKKFQELSNKINDLDQKDQAKTAKMDLLRQDITSINAKNSFMTGMPKRM